MKVLFFLIMLLLAAAACDQRDVLHEYNWLLVEAYHNGKALPTHDSRTTLVSKDGYQFFGFLDDNHTVVLPGLGTPSIVASWNIEDGKIYFAPDSVRYGLYGDPNANLNFLEAGDVDSVSTIVIDKVVGDNFQETMKFYNEPFEFGIVHDTLVLHSSRTTLVAVRNKSLDPFRKAIESERRKMKRY